MAQKGEAKKVVKIRCSGSGIIDVAKLQPFQGGLKHVSQEDYAKLRGLIEAGGFSFPVFVWRGEDGTQYLLDGHTRRATLLKMREEGWEVPPVPFAEVKASTFKEAKEKLLAAASQFGKISRQGLHEFAVEADIDYSFMQSNLALPDFNMGSFHEEFYNPEQTRGSDPWAGGGTSGAPAGTGLGHEGNVNRILLIYQDAAYSRIFQMAEQAMGSLNASDMSDLFAKLLEAHIARA